MMVGASAWILDVKDTSTSDLPEGSDQKETPARAALAYSRFPKRPPRDARRRDRPAYSRGLTFNAEVRREK
jgi:hypothetical protein